ncbi:MAG: hypothetical protein IPF99_30750 [Deltaproteobacteria bacterium]|nr:hypothetical protein [Deltaproteobacteria bacterium]
MESPILLGVRHVWPRASKASVPLGPDQWVSSITSVGDRRTARLGRASPLVILGGQYSGSRGLAGCGRTRSWWPSQREQDHGGWIEEPGADIRGVGFAQPTDIFGLDYDRLYR